MALFFDEHRGRAGLTAEQVANAHRRDLEVQDRYGVDVRQYWFDERSRRVIRLVEAATREAAQAVHRMGGGLLTDRITEVEAGVPRTALLPPVMSPAVEGPEA
jgi:hypothetical protein